MLSNVFNVLIRHTLTHFSYIPFRIPPDNMRNEKAFKTIIQQANKH